MQYKILRYVVPIGIDVVPEKQNKELVIVLPKSLLPSFLNTPPPKKNK
jgi:hypothetical protein